MLIHEIVSRLQQWLLQLLMETTVHAWDYRRYVLASMPIPRPETSELVYTTRKIESNFSNFSAWHQRSKVYTRLWENGTLEASKCKEEGTTLLYF